MYWRGLLTASRSRQVARSLPVLSRPTSRTRKVLDYSNQTLAVRWRHRWRAGWSQRTRVSRWLTPCLDQSLQCPPSVSCHTASQYSAVLPPTFPNPSQDSTIPTHQCRNAINSSCLSSWSSSLTSPSSRSLSSPASLLWKFVLVSVQSFQLPFCDADLWTFPHCSSMVFAAAHYRFSRRSQSWLCRRIAWTSCYESSCVVCTYSRDTAAGEADVICLPPRCMAVFHRHSAPACKRTVTVSIYRPTMSINTTFSCMWKPAFWQVSWINEEDDDDVSEILHTCLKHVVSVSVVFVTRCS